MISFNQYNLGTKQAEPQVCTITKSIYLYHRGRDYILNSGFSQTKRAMHKLLLCVHVIKVFMGAFLEGDLDQDQ